MKGHRMRRAQVKTFMRMSRFLKHTALQRALLPERGWTGAIGGTYLLPWHVSGLATSRTTENFSFRLTSTDLC